MKQTHAVTSCSFAFNNIQQVSHTLDQAHAHTNIQVSRRDTYLLQLPYLLLLTSFNSFPFSLFCFLSFVLFLSCSKPCVMDFFFLQFSLESIWILVFLPLPLWDWCVCMTSISSYSLHFLFPLPVLYIWFKLLKITKKQATSLHHWCDCHGTIIVSATTFVMLRLP